MVFGGWGYSYGKGHGLRFGERCILRSSLEELNVVIAMVLKDFRRRSQLLRYCSFTSFLCRALLPLLLSCIALWFFAFLLDRSRYHASSLRHHPLPARSAVIQRLDQDSALEELGKSNHQSSDLPTRLVNFSYSDKKAWWSAPVNSFVFGDADCDLSSGRWVRDEYREPAYDENCRDIFKGWNCLRNNKSYSRYILAWQWQPWQCDLPQLNATLFLEHFMHKRIGFVGDSLNRNMYVSLVCSLKRASGLVRKWRPMGADKAVTFLNHNLTLAYHRTNLLARYGWWDAKSDGGQVNGLGYKEGFRVDVDVPQSTWAEAPRFHDVLILSTGHWWWAPEKFDPVRSPMIFFEGGKPIIPTKAPEEGLDLVLKNMLNFVEREMSTKGLKFLRTQSPRHFEGGDWNSGGKCKRFKPLNADEVETFFAVANHGPNLEMDLVNQHLKEAIKGTSFQLLNISYMSSFRADGHPSKSAGKLHDDCMHWCLPGVTDSWNDMFVLHLLQQSINVEDSK